MEEVQDRRKRIKYETYNDHLENAKRYNIPRAQLIIADKKIEKELLILL